MIQKIAFLVFATLGSLTSIRASVDPINDSHEGNSTYPYRIFVPDSASESSPKPLVLYLAGLGEKGVDNRIQVQRHIQPLLDTTQAKDSPFSAILIAPQSPSGWWNGSKVNELVDQAESQYPIDRNRMYLIGISAGGGGCYVTAADQPKRWTAALCLSAVKDSASIPKLTSISLWMIHGEADTVVPPTASQQVYDELQALGATPKLSRIPNWSHGPWSHIFSDEEKLHWLFAQTLRIPSNALYIRSSNTIEIHWDTQYFLQSYSPHSSRWNTFDPQPSSPLRVQPQRDAQLFRLTR